MRTRTRPARLARTTPSGDHGVLRASRPETQGQPRADPRAFVSRLRRRIAATAVVTFGAFLGLAAVNVVGVTAHGPTPGGPAAETMAPVLPPGDFFGVPGGAQAAFPPVAQPPLLIGGGPPMLSSGGS
jgi:hypothetical protein